MQKYHLFIGIDISKQWIDVCASHDGPKKDMPHQRFDNNKKGFHQMVRFVRDHARQHRLEGPWLFCMEHTGVYVLPLCNFLEHQQLDYILESALQIFKSLGIRRGKSDKADAADIARYLFLHHREIKPYRLPSDTLLKINNLLRLHDRLTKAHAALKTAAKELKGFAGEALNKEVVQVSTDTMSYLKEQLNKVDRGILDLIKSSDELQRLYQLVTSVKGVGLIIGANLLVCTNGFKSFQTARQFACYIGVAPFGYSSGTTVKRPDQVSHLANKKIKALISNGAMSAIRNDQEIKAYYLRKIAEGKNSFLVQNNIKNKLVQRIFAVVKRGTPYVELSKFRA